MSRENVGELIDDETIMSQSQMHNNDDGDSTSIESDSDDDALADPDLLRALQASRQFVNAERQEELDLQRAMKASMEESTPSTSIADKPEVTTSTTDVPPVCRANTDSDDRKKTCSICFDPYETDSAHRLSCLPCGHMFGHSCIVSWVESKRFCPVCSTKCKPRKVIILHE